MDSFVIHPDDVVKVVVNDPSPVAVNVAGAVPVSVVLIGGPQGIPGSVGATGATGPAGAASTVPGPPGAKGETGSVGATGAKGDTGTAATVSVGTVSTGNPGSSATVTNSGTTSAAVFNFAIPRGADGTTGATGATGAAGSAATVNVGTVTTGAAGSSASVTNAGTSNAAVFNFAIPKGDVGATGAVGSAGATGATGAKGDTGAAGAAATVSVGTVSTGNAGSSATVTNVGTTSAAVFNFSIPRGDTGATGATGAKGDTGAAGTTSWTGITDKPTDLVTTTGTQSLTNKTLTSPVINNPTGIGAGTVGKNFFPTNSYASGYYYTFNFAASGSTTNNLGNNNLRLSSAVVTSTVSISRLWVEHTAAGEATAVLRIGIYADNGNGWPGSLVLDAGTVSMSGTAAVQEVTVSLTLTPGVYWVGGVVQGAATTQPTVRTINGITMENHNIPFGTTLPVAGTTRTSVVQGGVTGSLPSTFPVLSTSTISGSNPARIGFKVT